MGSANMGWRRSSTLRRSPPSPGAAPDCRGRHRQPPLRCGHGCTPDPMVPQHPQQHPPAHGGAGGPAAARQQASAHASRVHPPWDPQGTRPAPAPPQTPAAFRVFSAAGSRPIPWLRSCKSHIPIAAPREVAAILMHGQKGAGAAARRVPRPDSLDRHPRAGGLGSPAGSSSEDDTRDGTVCIPARRGDPLGELR